MQVPGWQLLGSAYRHNGPYYRNEINPRLTVLAAGVLKIEDSACWSILLRKQREIVPLDLLVSSLSVERAGYRLQGGKLGCGWLDELAMAFKMNEIWKRIGSSLLIERYVHW